MGKVYYKEVQKFNQFWFRLTILFTIVPIIGFTVYGFINRINDGNSEAAFRLFWVVFVLLIVVWLSFSAKLILKVDKTGLHYRFPPFVIKERTISKDSIDAVEIRIYSPLRDYHGWGAKRGVGRMPKAYTVSGNKGVVVKFDGSKSLLFGTQKPETLKMHLDKTMNKMKTLN